MRILTQGFGDFKNDVVGEGYRRIEWNGRDERGNPVSSGVYFYRLATGTRTLTRKMLLVR